MDVTDATKAAEFAGTTKVVGVHYDTFGYIKIDHVHAKNIFASVNKELLLPAIGESIDV
jgi:hypothetical protein